MSYDEHLISMAGGDGELDLLAMVREQRAAIERVRELHPAEMAAGRDGNGMTDYCPACSTYYPCATIAALTTEDAS